MPIYLDCNATTPIDPKVLEKTTEFLTDEFGNAGSRTHEWGLRAKRAVSLAREQIAALVDAEPDEIIFTSGATESNNLAILGLEDFGRNSNRRHIISTLIEHKAVIEPLEVLEQRGFDIEFVAPTSGGQVDPNEILKLVRDDTLLVSVMHVNNETGVIQPIDELSHGLLNSNAYFHVDAAQGFGKELVALRNSRIDLISISGHKIFAPKGIGALVTRRRDFERPPIQALMFGGGQERNLRPGTLPVHLIVALGEAAERADSEGELRKSRCLEFRENMLSKLSRLNPKINGNLEDLLPNTVSISFDGIDSEALMVALKDHIAISNGSACTSSSYKPSHVLTAMGLPEEQVKATVRISWCHLTENPDWDAVASIIKGLR